MGEASDYWKAAGLLEPFYRREYRGPLVAKSQIQDVAQLPLIRCPFKHVQFNPPSKSSAIRNYT